MFTVLLYVVLIKFRYSFLRHLDNRKETIRYVQERGYVVVQLLEAPLHARKSGSVSDGGPSSHTMAQGQLSLLTEMSTGEVSWGLRQLVHRLTTMPPSCADVPRFRSLSSLEL